MSAITILLYGATGYSGQLIAAELKLRRDADPDCRVILAGRCAETLAPLAERLGMAYRVFGLADQAAIERGLRNVSVVINAAGPFHVKPGGAEVPIADHLARAAITTNTHYVDISGEADCYQRLAALGASGSGQGIAMVGGAGFWAAASDLMFDTALGQLRARGSVVAGTRLGAVRIVMSRLVTVSRGSAATVWRALRDHVIVVRKRDATGPSGRTAPAMVVRHEAVGRLMRSFDFAASPAAGAAARPDPRITTAASLVDTLTARLTAIRNDVLIDEIESYVEAGARGRAAYHIGAQFVPVIAHSSVQSLVKTHLPLLADGPNARERDAAPHLVLLQIEDRWRSRIVDWRWETPNIYQFTAQLVVAVAAEAARGRLRGWRTPAEILAPLDLALTATSGPLRGCTLDDRRAARRVPRAAPQSASG